jgi:hypothetical protein
MKKVILVALAAGALIAQGERGIRPRPSASDYPAHQNGASATLAAALLSPEQTRKQFAVDLNHLGYVVVEIALYPDPSKNVEVAARDFMLKVSPEGTTLRPVSASTIAAQLHKKEPASSTTVPNSPVQISTGTTIGYGTGGTYPNGQRRPGGVYTDTGVGVGVGGPGQRPDDPRGVPPRPSSTSQGKDADSLSVQVDLENQALPEGKIDQPVAGYLYFTKPVMKKKSTVDLTWYGPGEQVKVPLPPK